MVSRENQIVIGFALLALGLTFAASALTDLSNTVLFGVLVVLGVVVPTLVNDYRSRRESNQ